MANVETGASGRVNASPAKAFFVEMITRDIELQDAILDLLDNCVDGVRRTVKLKGDKPYKGYFARITFSENQFAIEDNCGGIPLEIAKKYAFMMGRPAEYKDSKDGTIGVYGIGMKRAIFKMGRSCVVHSHTKADTFQVKITKDWLEDDKNWHLQANATKSNLKEHGTRITVSDLNSVIKSEFADGSDFRNKFPGVVRDAYSFLLAKGFKVDVNGESIKENLPKLLWDKKGGSDALRPYVYTADLEHLNVFVVVGFRDKPETYRSDEENSTDPHYSSEDAGWTIVCNDRVILPYNKGRETGWGWGGVPRYHTQFIAISGFVIFEGNPSLLPMTTTKRGVDGNSQIYMMVRERMQEGISHFTKFTNDWKGIDVSENFKNAKSFEIPEIEESIEEFKLRAIKGEGDQRQALPHLPERPKETTDRRIVFTKSRQEIEAVSMFLFETDDKKPSEVGAECFDVVFRKIK